MGSGWGGKKGKNRFVVAPDGSVAHLEQFAKQLFGSGRRDWRNPPTFEANYPVTGEFVVHVGEASRGILEIYLDENRVLREQSLDVPRKEIQKDFAIDVPAGRHEIRLDNAGGDWITLEYLLVTNYRDTRRYSDLDVWGLRSKDLELLWVRNRLNEWSFKAAGCGRVAAGPARVDLDGLGDGPCRVEWWDTCRGRIVKAEERRCQGGRLQLELPWSTPTSPARSKSLRS